MKIKTWTLMFIILISGFIFGQNEILVSEQGKFIDSLEIKDIDNIVDSIQLEKALQKTLVDSISFPSKFDDTKEFYKIYIYMIKNKIARISLRPRAPYLANNYSISSSSIDYFLDNNKLIFLNETFTDNSKTGLCGKIEKKNSFYYFEDNLIEKATNTCYNTCCDSFIKVDWLISHFEKAYKVSKERIN